MRVSGGAVTVAALLVVWACSACAQTVQPKIVGGTAAPNSAYPWMASLRDARGARASKRGGRVSGAAR